MEENTAVEDDHHIFSSNDERNLHDYSTVRIKTEPEMIHFDDDDLQYHRVESISSNVEETNPAEEIQIKTEIIVEETKVEKYSEFEKEKLNSRCKLCDFRCSWRGALWEHHKNAHPEESVTQCTICFVKFKGASQLEKHIEDEHQGLGNLCKICLSYYKRGQKNKHWAQCLGRLLFTCNICEERYVTKEGFLRHLDEHDTSEELKKSSMSELRVKQQVYSCEICKDDKAYRKDRYQEHTKEQHDGRYLQCPNCEKTFDRYSNRSQHMKQFCKGKPERSELPECSQSRNNSNNLENNVPVTQKNKSFDCPECGITFLKATALRKHKVNHHQQSLLNCSYCSQKFHSKGWLRRHMKSHGKISEKSRKKKFECQRCFKQFNRLHYFDKHIKQHNQENQKELNYTRIENEMNKSNKTEPESKSKAVAVEKKSTDWTKKKEFICKFCDFGFGSKTTLLTHKREVHPDNRPFLCDICRCVYNGTTELDKHVAEAHDGLGRKCRICFTQYRRDEDHDTTCLGRQLFNCDHCKISFLNKEGLWKHLDEHGMPEDLKKLSMSESQIKKQFFSCDICGDDRAYEKDPLREHAKDRHGGHCSLCTDCGKTFKNTNNLKRHSQKYCRVGPARERYKSENLKCPGCSKFYENRASLEDHIARYHRKNPYHCSQCHMKFSNAGEVRQHKIKTHMEWSLSCSYCTKKFKLRHEFQKHMRSHTNQTNSKLEV